MPLKTRVHDVSRVKGQRLAQGFTLIELLVVVSIIAISAALAVPAISGSIQARTASQATLDLVRVARHARAASTAYGRAYMLRYETDSNPGTLGQVRLFRGTNNGCNTNDWVTIMAGGACGTAGSMCVDSLTMADNRYQRASSEILMRVQDFAALDLCFEPSGIVRHRSGTAVNGGWFRSDNSVDGGFIFTFQRLSSGAPVGVVRRVLFPLGGDARVLR